MVDTWSEDGTIKRVILCFMGMVIVAMDIAMNVMWSLESFLRLKDEKSQTSLFGCWSHNRHQRK